MPDKKTNRRVAVAVLDTGVAPVDDLCLPQNRLIAFKDVVNGKTEPYDDNGHGTHVAGIIGGNGLRSGGEYCGYAPDCDIVGVKILDQNGRGKLADALAGLRWLMSVREKYNIRVANLSIGSRDASISNPLVRAAESIWDSGVVVVTAAGNLGPEPGTVTAPGTSRKVITVGSFDDRDRSGNGPTSECILKPDVLASGTNIVSCLTNTPLPERRTRELNIITPYYVTMSGTSMAAPSVSGFAARLLTETPSMTPDEVKFMIMREASDGTLVPSVHPDGVYEIDAECKKKSGSDSDAILTILCYMAARTR